MRSRRAAVALLLSSTAVIPLAHGSASAAGATCPAPPRLTFAPPSYVDRTRAGGEPLVATYPSGRLLYSSHAGTTHFFTPTAVAPGSGAFAENYTGQTYFWTSDDNGRTWQFRPRTAPGQGAVASGFSDPEIALDSAGNVFFSEINLVNVAVSKSADKGSTFRLQNFGGAVLTDRQWMEADRKDELYFVANGQPGGTGVPPGLQSGHYISKSVDGGKTFTPSISDNVGGSGLGDIRVDKRTGTVYEAHYSSGKLSINAFRKARSGNLVATDSNLVAADVDMLAHWPAFDLDPSGNLYITWDEAGTKRPAGVYYSRSTDAGRHWAAPVRVSTGTHTAIWPWLGVGDNGRVGIAWLEADKALPDNSGETSGTYGWRIMAAATTTGLGCSTSRTPTFSRAVATPTPIHVGTICQGGTTCQATLTDRRLGDYFSVDVDNTGRMYVGYADTQVDAAVSLPAFVRQRGGPSLLLPNSGTTRTPSATTGQPSVAVPRGSLPGRGVGLAATGLDDLLPELGVLLLLAGWLWRRRQAA
jgi:hypothetical protein